MGINVNIYNIVFFNVAWLCCVLGGNTLAAFAVVTFTWLHFQLVSGNCNEWPQLILVTLIGILYDSLLIVSGVLQMPEWSDTLMTAAYLPPFWMVCLWWLFGTTLRHSLKWFLDKPLLSITGGAVAGLIAYRAGAALTGVEFGYSEITTALILAASWAVIFPCLLRLTNYSNERLVTD